MLKIIFDRIKNHPVVFIIMFFGSVVSIIAFFAFNNRNDDSKIIDEMDNRVYVNKSAEELISIFDDKTTIQAEKIVNNLYKGKWVKFYYPLKEAETYNDQIRTILEPFKDNDRFYIFAYFNSSWKNKIGNLNKGEAVAVSGKILYLASDHIFLSESELIEATDEIKSTAKNLYKLSTPVSKKLDKISLNFFPAVNEKNRIEILSQIRNNNGVRPLIPIESGKTISSTPVGTYFYMSPVYFSITEGGYKYFLNRGSINRFPTTSSYFELHYFQENKLFIIGYINDANIPVVSILDGETTKDITISPELCEQFNTLILLPLSRVVKSSDREIEISINKEIRVLDIIVR